MEKSAAYELGRQLAIAEFEKTAFWGGIARGAKNFVGGAKSFGSGLKQYAQGVKSMGGGNYLKGMQGIRKGMAAPSGFKGYATKTNLMGGRDAMAQGFKAMKPGLTGAGIAGAGYTAGRAMAPSPEPKFNINQYIPRF